MQEHETKLSRKYFNNIIMMFRKNLYESFWHHFWVWDLRDSVEGVLYFLNKIFIYNLYHTYNTYIGIFMVYGSWITKWTNIVWKVFTEISSASEWDRANYRHMGVDIITNVGCHEYTISKISISKPTSIVWMVQNVKIISWNEKKFSYGER